MAVSITHQKVSTVPPTADPDLVSSDDWNDDHDFSGTAADIGAAPNSGVDYLVGTASGALTGEIIVGTAPGGELGGSWSSPTVDTTHAGSTHTAATTTHEAASDPHPGYVLESLVDAAGDLIIGTADNTVGRLPRGTALQVLRVNAGGTTIEYADPAGLDTTIAFAGDITPTALSGTVNDYAPTGLATASTIRLSTNDTTTRTINGLTGGADGRMFFLHNLGPGSIALKDEAAGSTAGNRFALVGDVILLPDTLSILQYDSTSLRWRVARGATAATDPALTFGTTNVGGTSPYFVRSDDQLALFDATAPSTQAFGDAAATGAAAVAARRDHKHAMPADPFIAGRKHFATFAKQGVVTATAEGDTPPPMRVYNRSGRTLTFAVADANATIGPNGSTSTIDLNVDGTTIMTGTKIVLPDNSGAASVVTQATFSTTTIADGHYLSCNVDTTGGGAMQNLVVTVWVTG